MSIPVTSMNILGDTPIIITGDKLRPRKENPETESTGGCWGGGGIALFMGSSEQRGNGGSSSRAAQ